MATAIEFRDVSLQAPDGRLLLDGVNLRLEEGTTTAVLGRSGSGKTTLLRLVNRMADPSGGTVFIRGKECEQHNPIQLRRGMGYVIQETGLFPHFTVARNVGMVPELNGKRIDEARIGKLLEQVGLGAGQFSQRYPHQLSGGQRQRVGLARALAADPPILLMDEPFGALDPLTRAEMQDMLRALLERLKKTVLLVTHDLDEALYLASRIVLLEGGKMVTDVAAEDFLKSEIPAVKAYAEAFHRSQKEPQ
ncbi:ATP-binding cassette domain-containing protein [Acidobacterium sp. S8]|uniref:ATP-binding cassette domain-containing protein n=1 Tax=Acidobacterium sp. S8 TaxID=1641854 RepID=UPI00131BACD0|nr:ATP-binding cassette domain-containing protein [Acidobacterium sp. S8]